MKKLVFKIVVLLYCLFIISCNRTENKGDYVKKVEVNEETIVVGIYKSTGIEYPNIKYIAEALKIDGGIVYVTLTDSDVLKTRLENIDVIVFAGIRNGQKVDAFDKKIADIIKDFILIKGKGAVGICNGGNVLKQLQNIQSHNLTHTEIKENSNANINNGIIKFKLSEEGLNMFPELIGFENLKIDFNKEQRVEILDTINKINVLGKMTDNENCFPLFISSKQGKGRIVITNTNPEITPGMRWMIPRMVRWSVNKEFISYDYNIIRPDFFKSPVNLNKELNSKFSNLLFTLDEGKKDEIISAMDTLQEIYPWIASEKVRSLLIEKNNDIKLRAAKYLVDIEYTLAIDDLNQLIKREKRKKIKEQFIIFKKDLENMIRQN